MYKNLLMKLYQKIFTKKAIMTNNQLLFWGKKINHLTKSNCTFYLHLCFSVKTSLYLFLHSIKYNETIENKYIKKSLLYKVLTKCSCTLFLFLDFDSIMMTKRCRNSRTYCVCIFPLSTIAYFSFQQIQSKHQEIWKPLRKMTSKWNFFSRR